MSLTLYFHPLSSFCQKVLVALYENDTPFTPHIVDLGNEASRAALTNIWPIGKFPVLRDEAADRMIPESSIIIEYLAQHYPGKVPLVPADPDLARRTRLKDRFFDLYVNVPMQKVVTDRLRPAGQNDPLGVAQARTLLETALYYANLVTPFGDTHRHAAAYLDRLTQRPSFVRVDKEAQPYRSLFPSDNSSPIRKKQIQ
jgi:glutathione S-transferase